MDYYIFTGRCNPPHQGHIESLKMLDKAAENGKSFIALTGTQDPKKNPLTFEQKYKYVKVAVDSWNLNIEVIDRPIIKIYDLLRDKSFDCEKSGGGTVYLFAGEDRIESYQKMADGIIKKYQARNEIKNVSIIVEKTMNRDSSLAYSATQMRQHVIDGDIEEFIKHCPFKSSQDENLKLCENMFYDLEVGMGLRESDKSISSMYETTEQMAEKVSNHINQLSGEQDKLYYVGGCVRDLLMGKEPNDLDLVTTMYYKDFAELFKTDDIRYRGQNIIVVPTIEGEEYETACLTKDTSLEDRLLKSDITINAMAQDILTGVIIDPLNGQSDIENKIIRNTDFMIQAFGNGQQPVAFLRTIRFYSVLEDFELDLSSNEALFAFSEKNNHKLKVTDRQFKKEYDKIVKAGEKALQRFNTKLKELGLYDYLVSIHPEMSVKKLSENKKSTIADALNIDECINDNLKKDQLIKIYGEKLLELLRSEYPDFMFRVAENYSTYGNLVIDCTEIENPNQDSIPDLKSEYFVKTKRLINKQRFGDGYLCYFRDDEPVKPDKDGIPLYFITRAHQETKLAHSADYTVFQECLQGKAIEERIFDGEELKNIVLKYSKDLSKIEIGGQSVSLKNIQKEAVLKDCNDAVKTAKAFYEYIPFNFISDFKVYHSKGKDNPFGTLVDNIAKPYRNKLKDSWNPMDILITNLTNADMLEIFKDVKSLPQINSIMRCLIKKTTDKNFIPTREDGLDTIHISEINKRNDIIFVPISLKMNRAKRASVVEQMNVNNHDKQFNGTDYTKVEASGQAFIFKTRLDSDTFLFKIRTHGGNSAIIESQNINYNEKDSWRYNTDIEVSKEKKNQSSYLGKALTALLNYSNKLDPHNVEECARKTEKKCSEEHRKIDWETNPDSLPSQLHKTWIENKDDKNENISAAAKLCGWLGYYILYQNWTSIEAYTYIVHAAMKKNYGKMNAFAPLYKIS